MATRLSGFLRRARDTLQSKVPHESLVYVLGNEAADLDSMVSAISYAFLRQETETSPNRFYIPVISIPGADFALRGECVYAFSRILGPTPVANALCFLDQVPLSPESSLILVDHNQLCPSLSHLSDRVTCIIDHHKDDELYRTAEPRLIEPVGSTCSLVALEWQRASANGGAIIEESVASLLLSGILMDTICLDNQYGRTTQKDLDAVAYLKLHIPESWNPDFGTQLYKSLQHAKSDVQHLSSRDLLRKDFKKWTIGSSSNLGISSVMWNLESWMARDTQQNIDWLHMMPLFAREHQLDVSCIMTAYNDAESNEFCRELVIGIHSETISKESVLQALIVSELELEPLPSLSRHDIQAFRQRNVKASRKQVHPILSDILEESLKQSRI